MAVSSPRISPRTLSVAGSQALHSNMPVVQGLLNVWYADFFGADTHAVLPYSDRLARFPYLAADFSLMPREAGVTDWMSDIHMFNIASTMSFGPSGSSINAMTTAVPKLVAGLTRGLLNRASDAICDNVVSAAVDAPSATNRVPSL